MVTNLAKQVEDFQVAKQKIDKFLKADLDGLIKTFTYDYLTDNLVEIVTPEVTSLIEPIKDNLEHRIRSVVKKMLSTTPFTLQPAKASKSTPTISEPSFDDLLAQLYDKVAYKTTQTTEEKALVDAISENLSKESCKDAAGTLKRSRKDDDPDPNSKGKKHKSETGPSSSQQPQKDSTPPGNQQHTSATGQGPTDEEETLMHPTDDSQGQPDTDYRASPVPDSQTGPSSPSKTKDKDATSMSKKAKKRRRHSWLDNDDTPVNHWLIELVNAQPPIEDEEPLPGNTLQFTQVIMKDLQIEKLTKAELKRINRDAQDFLKSRSGNKMEYEFHMQNIASAMSSQFDWLNPDVNFDA